MGRWDEVRSMLKDYKKDISSSLSQYKDMKEQNRRRSPSPIRGDRDSVFIPPSTGRPPYTPYGY